MKEQRVIMLAWPADKPDAPPLARMIEGPAQPKFQAAIDSGKFRRVECLTAHAFETWEAR